MGDFQLSAPAKVNLFLDVGPLRLDGYHEIVSVMQTVALCDQLRVKLLPTGSLSLTSTDPLVPVGRDNTTTRAYEAFRRLVPSTPPLELRIEKRIPMQAGLGGGSSNAGTLLYWLWKTFGSHITRDEIEAVAASVGSDVPFFLRGGTCLLKGRGERVTSLPSLPSAPILLIHPEVAISTAEAYRLLDQLPGRSHPAVDVMLEAVQQGDWEAVRANLHNSFEAVVLERYPLLGAIHRSCRLCGFPAVLLCGSGSNLFVLASSRESLSALARQIQNEFPKVRTTLTSTTTPK